MIEAAIKINRTNTSFSVETARPKLVAPASPELRDFKPTQIINKIAPEIKAPALVLEQSSDLGDADDWLTNLEESTAELLSPLTNFYQDQDQDQDQDLSLNSPKPIYRSLFDIDANSGVVAISQNFLRNNEMEFHMMRQAMERQAICSPLDTHGHNKSIAQSGLGNSQALGLSNSDLNSENNQKARENNCSECESELTNGKCSKCSKTANG